MPPKARRTPSTVAKKKASRMDRKKPSQTTSAANQQKNATSRERSVMQSVEQEPTDNGSTVPNRKTPSTQQMVPIQTPAVANPVMKTVMLPPVMGQPPPPVPVAPLSAPPQLMTPPANMPVTPMAPIIPPPPTQPQIDTPSAAPPAKRLSREREEAPISNNDDGSDKRKKTDAIVAWIRSVLANGIEGLKKEYKESPNEGPLEKSLAFTENPTRNRYHNIPCCEATRVKLPDDPHYYLHANLVSSGPNPRRFICCQAPLVSTIEDFWKMVIVSGLEYIVMLCEIVEKGKPKSAEYFPSKIGEPMRIGRLCTVTKESTVDLDKCLSMSVMRISKIGETTVAMTVKHIHWHNWPDHGVPDNFLSPFRLLTIFKNSVKPIVVHCSAGVGRTGTLVLILIILESLRLPEFVGVPRLLAKLREERFKAIQTEMQYLYVHRCILEYLKLKKYTCNPADFAKFAKDYDVANAAFKVD